MDKIKQAEYIYTHKFKSLNYIMQKQIVKIDLSFIEQNMTNYVVNSAK